MRVLAAACLALVACFEPAVIDGSFECVNGDECPPQFFCRLDCGRRCYRNPTGSCEPDAAVPPDSPPGTPDSPPGTPDGPPGSPDGPIVIVPDGPPGTPDGPIVPVPDGPIVMTPDAPVVIGPDAPVVTMPDAPVVTMPDAPVVTMPDAPVVTMPDAPIVSIVDADITKMSDTFACNDNLNCDVGETCTNCPLDCGACMCDPDPQCTGCESCVNCPQCGACDCSGGCDCTLCPQMCAPGTCSTIVTDAGPVVCAVVM